MLTTKGTHLRHPTFVILTMADMRGYGGQAKITKRGLLGFNVQS
ncbi:MAG: hypothetical protein WCJ56_05045 [bacterium]